VSDQRRHRLIARSRRSHKRALIFGLMGYTFIVPIHMVYGDSSYFHKSINDEQLIHPV
jgi:hypothetical protein